MYRVVQWVLTFLSFVGVTETEGGGHKLEVNILPRQIHANSKGELINEGSVMSSEYGTCRIWYLSLLLSALWVGTREDDDNLSSAWLHLVQFAYKHTFAISSWFVCTCVILNKAHTKCTPLLGTQSCVDITICLVRTVCGKSIRFQFGNREYSTWTGLPHVDLQCFLTKSIPSCYYGYY